MKATTTIVAMALTALAVAPQRTFAQYGPVQGAPYPGSMPPGGPYGAQANYGAPAYNGAPQGYYPQQMMPAGPYGMPPGAMAYPVAPAGYQDPAPMPPGMAGANPMPPGAGYQPAPGGYGPPPGAYPQGGAYGPPPGAGGAYGPPQGYDPGAAGYGQPPMDGGYAGEGGYEGDAPAGDAGCDTCGACDDCGCGCGLAPVFFGAEWLLWRRHGQQTPPLVTTSPAGALPANAGVLGAGGITTFGGNRIDDGFVPGFRFTSGLWLDPNQEVAIGGRIFSLGQDKTTFTTSSPTGQPIIARPFANFADPNNPVSAAFVVAFDDGDPATAPRSGLLSAVVTNDVWGGDLFSSVMLTTGTGYRVDLTAGYQYYRIDEAVAVSSTSVQGANFFNDNIPNGTTLTLQDVFDTQNEFHGGALGMLGEMQEGAFSLKLLGRIAVGNMHETLRINGSRIVTPPPPAQGPPLPAVVFPGGLLAQPSNIGISELNRTTLVPEMALTCGYNFSQNLTFTLGYSCIYWNHVAQAGPSIDPRVDLTQVNPFPVRFLRDTDFWVMGLNGGIEWRY